MYDYMKHAEEMLEVESLISYALMASEGLQPADDQMQEAQFRNTSTGVFGLIAFALDKAQGLLQERESDFRKAHGIGYGKGGKAVEREDCNNDEWLFIRAMRKATPEVRKSITTLLHIGGVGN